MAKDEILEGITVKKDKDFSEWFTQLTQKAELCDLRYNVKGFVVYRPNCVIVMKKMYRLFERLLEKKGHQPLFMPVLIPESNFTREAEHVEGFTPEVFWVTEHGKGEKFEEKLALRPTSETAFHQMFAHWIRSYQDLPLKTYQSHPVYRYETKATRPFFRGREIHWIEAHDVLASENAARDQVHEDIETTKELVINHFAIPVTLLRRPEWDKFAGADETYAADVIMPSGRVLQVATTHMLGTSFSEAFGIKFTDQEGNEQFGHLTSFGPGMQRIYGAMVAIHGDDKGLVVPFELCPKQVVIVPIIFEKSKDRILKKAESLKKKLKGFRPFIDSREDKSAGWKFNNYELKGIPVRVEVGPKDLEKGTVVISLRDTGEKKTIKESDLFKEVEKIKDEFTQNLLRNSRKFSESHLLDVSSLKDLKNAVEAGNVVRAPWCAVDSSGKPCADNLQNSVSGAEVRGIRADSDDKPSDKDKCVICAKKANHVVYIAKAY